MDLNETMDFSSAPSAVKRAFLSTPEKIRIAARQRLYKWTDIVVLTGPQVTAWWNLVEQVRLPGGGVMEGFKRSEELARRIGVTHRQYAKTRSAISDQFGNRMSRLLLVELKVAVWGFAGKASGQREFADEKPELSNVYSTGGAYQVWIPNLSSPDHLQQIPTEESRE